MNVKLHVVDVEWEGNALVVYCASLTLTQAERDYFVAWYLGVRS